MNVTYVSDNRTGANWGCRSTSIALAQLIQQRHSINNTIFNDLKKKRVYVGSRIPQYLLDRIYWRKDSNLIAKVVVEIDLLLGAKLDYVTWNPKESVQLLLTHMHEQSVLYDVYDKLRQADMIVINGEGDMIFNPHRRTLAFLLMVVELANEFDIPVYYVNAMVSECPTYGRPTSVVTACIEALEKCAGVALRDPESVTLLKDLAPDVQCRYIPDSLFHWVQYCGKDRIMQITHGDAILPFKSEVYFGQYDFSSPYICVGGSSAPGVSDRQAICSYSSLVKNIQKLGYPVYLVQSAPGDDFLKEVATETNVPFIPVEVPILLAATILANAQLLVSGRYHPSVMASLGGTPCIFLASNSHKTSSLQQVLQYDQVVEFPAIPDQRSISDIVQHAETSISAGRELREKISTKVVELAEQSKEVLDLIDGRFSSRTDVG